MAQKDNILQELNELNSNLANLGAENVYAVPAGYFEGLAERVLNRIKAMNADTAGEELGYLSPLLKDISKKMPYSVPADYFEGLNHALLNSFRNNNQTVKEELESLSPLLSGLKKEMPYSVPQGYFDNLANPVTRPETKVVSMVHRKWFRYAAAAVITGVIIMAGFLIFNNGNSEPGSKPMADVKKDLNKLNDTQKDNLIDFLDPGFNGTETVSISPGGKSDDIKELLKGVSDEELKEFKQQTEDIEEVLMVN
jgi:hypothetical protein